MDHAIDWSGYVDDLELVFKRMADLETGIYNIYNFGLRLHYYKNKDNFNCTLIISSNIIDMTTTMILSFSNIYLPLKFLIIHK